MSVRKYGLFTRLIRTRPLLLSSVLFLLGCILGYRPGFPLWILLSACVACLVAAAVLRGRFRRIAAVFMLHAVLPLGAARFEAAWDAVDPLPDQTNVILCGRIASVPEQREDTERTICVLRDLTIDGKAVHRSLRFYLRGDDTLRQNVSLGQRITCEANIWQGNEATNPGQFSFSNYLRVNGLSGYATAEIENAVLSHADLRLTDIPARFCQFAGNIIDKLFPRNADIARAFLIGDRSRISEENRASYSNSGAAHLLSLSGMHIALIAMLLQRMLMRFIRRRNAFLILLAFLCVYGWLIGFSPSFTRAMLMFAYGGLARVFGRRRDAVTGLAASMLIWLLIRPLDILSASFVLSYSATAGILFLASPLKALLHLEAPMRKPSESVWTRRILIRLAGMALMTAAAQIAMLPAIVHFFGAQPMLSFFVNLFAVPIAMVAYMLAIPGALLHLKPICAISDALFGLLTRVVKRIGAIPFASVRIARFPIWLLLICAAACLLASELCALPKKIRRFLPLTVVLAIFISNFLAYATTFGTSVVFLDAGEADCAVIRASGKVYLVDAGDDYSPAADYLSAMNYVPEAVFLSHPHADHICGLNEVLDFCAPKRIFVSANWDAFALTESATAVLMKAEDAGCEIVHVSAGDSISIGEKTIISVLAPEAGISANSANEDSMVLSLQHGGSSVLFLADASANALRFPIPDVDVVKIGHHGAAGAVDQSLLESTSPSACVISVGENNFGHPDADTLAMIDAAGAAIFRTDLSGAITCALSDSGTVRINTFRST